MPKGNEYHVSLLQLTPPAHSLFTVGSVLADWRINMGFPYQTEETPLKIYGSELSANLLAALRSQQRKGNIAIKEWPGQWECWGLTQIGKDWIVELSFNLEP